MSVPIVFTKSLGTAHSNGIAASQSVSANTAFVLNGSLTNYLSTTSSAAAAAGKVVIPMTSTTGVTVGQVVTDSTAAALVTGTVVVAVSSSSVTIWPPVGGPGVGSGDTIVFTGVASIDAFNATTNSANGRRVVVAYTGTDGNFTVIGTNAGGATVTDVFAGSGGAGQSNLDFVTVSKITPVNSLTGATAGTNGVGSSPWSTPNWHTTPLNLSFAVEIVSGAVNYTIEHTYDDPNNLLGSATYPLNFQNATVNGVSANAEGVYALPIAAIRVLINSGTGQLRVRYLQAGIG